MNNTYSVQFNYGTVNGKAGPSIIKHAVAANPTAAIREASKLVHPCLGMGRDTLTIVSTMVTRL